MPDYNLSSQALDLTFHPNEDIVYTTLLNGEIKCYGYDEEGQITPGWSCRPTKKSGRAIDITPRGDCLWVGNKNGTLHSLDTASGSVLRQWPAHTSSISRLTSLTDNMHVFVTGDDNGSIKLWDTRLPLTAPETSNVDCVRSYTHHSDYISDFAWVPDKKHLIATSGDGTLSVIDVRSNKKTPFAQSEDQEDELLSVVPFKNGRKLVVGTQLGPLTIFDRAKGYGDCVDRFIGHPHSVETMVLLSSSPLLQNVIATGSSDGLIRVMQLHPSKFLGVIAAHNGPEQSDVETRIDKDPSREAEGFPVERMKLDRREKWLGSISHDEILKLTDVEGALEASEGEEGNTDSRSTDEEEEENRSEMRSEVEKGNQAAQLQGEQEDALEISSHSYDEPHHSDHDSDSAESIQKEPRLSKKRRRKEKKREEAKKRKKGQGSSNSFFADL
ncbi:WD40 repeat-like protein [Serendipita vermifera]|nr:WD40 repeat-like protein [Serendipita vermifera]